MLNQTRQQLESRLIEKANQDPEFRKILLDNPKEALAQVLGVKLPDEIKITVIEEEVGHHVLVLPPAPVSVEALPLKELELALIGGGRTLRPGAGAKQVVRAPQQKMEQTSPLSSSC